MKIDSFFCSLISLLSLQFALMGCQTNEPRSVEPIPPTNDAMGNRYGADGEAPNAGQANGRGGRFGFSGDNSATAGAGGDSADGNRQVREMTKRERDAAEAARKEEEARKKAKSDGPPDPADYKYANKVAGDPLSVTLPGKNASLGQISIEKYDASGQPTGQPLARGTPVAIPDPNNPGKKIYFKVP